jgi:hypothetical protein
VTEGGRLAGAVENWAIISSGHGNFGDIVYVALVVAVIAVTRLPRGWWRVGALVPTVYLAALVWENAFIQQPQVARWILFGTLLIALMTVRPQGLLGTPRVEIV